MPHQSYVLEPSAWPGLAAVLAAWAVVLAVYGLVLVGAVGESRRLP